MGYWRHRSLENWLTQTRRSPTLPIIKQLLHPVPPVSRKVHPRVPRHHQKKTHGIRHQVRTQPAWRLHDRQNHKENMGSLLNHQGQRCHQAHQQKCALSTGSQDHGGWSVLRNRQDQILCQKQRTIHQEKTKTHRAQWWYAQGPWVTDWMLHLGSR